MCRPSGTTLAGGSSSDQGPSSGDDGDVGDEFRGAPSELRTDQYTGAAIGGAPRPLARRQQGAHEAFDVAQIDEPPGAAKDGFRRRDVAVTAVDITTVLQDEGDRPPHPPHPSRPTRGAVVVMFLCDPCVVVARARVRGCVLVFVGRVRGRLLVFVGRVCVVRSLCDVLR